MADTEPKKEEPKKEEEDSDEEPIVYPIDDDAEIAKITDLELKKKVLDAKIKVKDREDYEFPKFGEPKQNYFFELIQGVNSFVNICSFLPLKDMIQITQLNRFAYNTIMDDYERRRNRIFFWDFSAQEEDIVDSLVRELNKEGSATKKELQALLDKPVKIAS
jgi:hypothetical protein